MNSYANARYATQLRLPQVGQVGQARLARARVLVIGAGGLGSAVLPLLAGAGVGTLRIVDPDYVEEGNLHRQTLYRMADIGQPKAMVAADALHALNPYIRIDAEVAALDPVNAPSWVAESDVVIDAADLFAVSYALSDVCLTMSKVLVSASVQGSQGYAGVFCGGAPSYRALFPQWPRSAADCATVGVLGPTVALLGCLQAELVLAILLGVERDPRGSLWRWDAQRFGFSQFDFWGAEEPVAYCPVLGLSQVAPEDVLIDLRSLQEAPNPLTKDALRCELCALESVLPRLPRDRRIVLACRSGLRASQAAERLKSVGYRDLALLALG